MSGALVASKNGGSADPTKNLLVSLAQCCKRFVGGKANAAAKPNGLLTNLHGHLTSNGLGRYADRVTENHQQLFRVDRVTHQCGKGRRRRTDSHKLSLQPHFRNRLRQIIQPEATGGKARAYGAGAEA